MTTPYVIGIGNAVMDMIAPCEDAELDRLGIEKGIMQLIDRPRAEELTAAQGRARLVPGGSVANTLAGIGMLGLRTAFVGRVADDGLGRAYAQQTSGKTTKSAHQHQVAEKEEIHQITRNRVLAEKSLAARR